MSFQLMVFFTTRSRPSQTWYSVFIFSSRVQNLYVLISVQFLCLAEQCTVSHIPIIVCNSVEESGIWFLNIIINIKIITHLWVFELHYFLLSYVRFCRDYESENQSDWRMDSIQEFNIKELGSTKDQETTKWRTRRERTRLNTKD